MPRNAPDIREVAGAGAGSAAEGEGCSVSAALAKSSMLRCRFLGGAAAEAPLAWVVVLFESCCPDAAVLGSTPPLVLLLACVAFLGCSTSSTHTATACCRFSFACA
jgi:hypothetical protein